MLNIKTNPLNYSLLISCLLLTSLSNSVAGVVEVTKASPLSFHYSDLECDFSINAVKPAEGADVAIGDTVAVTFDYTINNVPAGIQITVFPGIISNQKDFQNYLPVKGIQLSGDNTLLYDSASPSALTLNGQLHFEYINQGIETGAFDAIIASLRFERLATKDDELGIPGSAITAGVSHLRIASKDINCEEDITENVDWVFLDNT